MCLDDKQTSRQQIAWQFWQLPVQLHKLLAALLTLVVSA